MLPNTSVTLVPETLPIETCGATPSKVLAWFEPLIGQIEALVEAGNRLIELR